MNAVKRGGQNQAQANMIAQVKTSLSVQLGTL